MPLNTSKRICIYGSPKFFFLGIRNWWQLIELSTEHKCVGIIFTADFKWNKHVYYMTRGKSWSIRIHIAQVLAGRTGIKWNLLFYACTRPKREYASAIWNPFKYNDERKNIRNCTARFVTWNYDFRASIKYCHRYGGNIRVRDVSALVWNVFMIFL